MQEPVAIVGIGCRFPGASSPQEFWRLLKEGKAAIRETPQERWNLEDVYDPDSQRPAKTRVAAPLAGAGRWGGFIDQVDHFDWRAFRIPPREARYMDPQHRLLLEVAWESLEDAGIPLQEVAGSETSVSIGIGWSDYLMLQSRDWSLLDGYTATGNASCFAANRISYTFDTRAESIALDAGCSSSLYALHHACQNLWTQEADLALAGGVHLMLSPAGSIMSTKSGLLARDGRCKTLDASADGFVNGEGAGVVVLKRLSDVRASDRIYALLNTVAVNHNGHNKWIVATSKTAQETLLHHAYHKAGINPAEVDYVELHGTGFLDGDAIEAQALGAVVGNAPGRQHPCLIGSVKTNLGHLANAAGMAGMIKVALALYHKEIPPTLHVQNVNPAIHLQELQLDIPHTTRPWPAKEITAVAAVSTISLSGANAHAILSATEPFQQPTEEQDTTHLLLLSAHSESALRQHAATYRDFLNNEYEQGASWGDICYSASARRTHHPYRLALMSTTTQQAAARLNDFLNDTQTPAVRLGIPTQDRHHRVTFVFAPHYRLDEARHLLTSASPFRTTVEEYDRLIARYTNHSAQREINNTATHTLASPLTTFVAQIAHAALWRSLGIVADTTTGNGYGQITAATIAGTITLEQAISIILHASAVEKNTNNAHPEHPGVATINPYLATEHIATGQSLSASQWNMLSTLHSTASTQEHSVCIEIGTKSTPSIQATAMPSAQIQEQTISLETLGLLYTHGYSLDWSAYYAYRNHPYHCVSLPTFPWQREKLWLDGLRAKEARQTPLTPVESTHQDIHSANIEHILATLWSDVLGLQTPDTQTHFFQMGGHSLLATQLLARIHTTTGIALSLDTLLKAPTPAQCAALISTLQATGEKHANTLPTIEHDLENRFQPFPTTDVQQAYWTGRNIALKSAHFGNHGYIEVAARALDIERFNRALQALIQRHEMLRAVLLPDGQQHILASVPPFTATVLDLRGHDEKQTRNALLHLRNSMDHQLLPVEQWPAFDIRIVLLDDNQAQIHLSVESLFIDAWSMHLLVQEFIQYYHDPSCVLPTLELSFRDYLLAENRLRDTEAYKKAQDYWHQRIASLPPAPDLPLRQDSDDTPTPRFVHYEGTIDKENWTRLKTRAAHANVTPSGVLLAAFADVLATWSKSPRFSINLSIFHRLPLHPQVHDIVGDFTSLIVLAVDPQAGDTFEQRAIHLQAQLWRDLDHSVYNGVQVLRELARGHKDMLKAVMPIVFSSLLIQDMANREPPPWQNTLYALSQTPQVWLDHQVLEADGQLIFHWQVIESLFPDGMISAMFAAYQQSLQRLALHDSPWQQIAGATKRSLVPPEQLAQRTHMNATDETVDSILLHQLFEQQMRQRETQSAVITAQHVLSYKDVYNGALRLSRHLQSMGARPNHIIAIVMQKGWEQIVAVLGILYAGAAYLPIEADLPIERLHYLLADGQVHIALTQPQLDTHITWPDSVQHLCIDTSYLQHTDIITHVPQQKVDDLAYVIYTSGSTGRPKGVMIDHRGAVNTILDINHRFHIESNDRVFALSALAFDLSVYDIFGTLAAGATIVMPTPTTLRNPAAWLSMLLEQHVTVWNSVPALLQMLVDSTEFTPDALHTSHLRLALLSGDWIPLHLPEQIKTRVPGIRVISLGGATEASIWSVFYAIEAVDPHWKSIPYGRPLRNQHLFILNEQGETCPVWVPGHLFIAGIGLAQGYWHDEEKTHTHFIHHPQTGERMYKTGDLGRYLPDGQIEFLGREDFQVKIHGHRIELGEIEATLLQYPHLSSAVVTAVAPTTRDEKRLVAYVVLHSPANNTHTSTRQDIHSQLEQTNTLHPDTSASVNDPVDTIPFHYHLTDAPSPHMDLQFGLSNTQEFAQHEKMPLTYPHNQSQGYTQRLSHRVFALEPIPFEQFSAFMHSLASMEVDGLPKYRYPSAGAIYPVQIYLSIKADRVERLPEGMYYYQRHTHQLVLLSDHNALSRNAHGSANQPIFDASAFSLFFVGDVNTIAPIYGDAARDFCLLEAGYIGQLLMMEAAKYSLGLCPIGDMAFEPLRPFLALHDNHIFLHSMLGGAVNPTHNPGWSFASTDTPAANPTADIRRFLQDRLPAYMLPSTIMILDALPLTANGKVDRQRLPPPYETQSTTIKIQHQTDLESILMQLWAELLPTSEISPEENFFLAGGDSLLIVRLYTRLQKQFQINTSIDTFFQHQTIRSLAKALQPIINRDPTR